VRLFIDESPPPDFALRLNATGAFDAIHPLHVGRRGEPDHRVLARCREEGRIIVTQNARDFRKLVGREADHPGLIILPGLGKSATWRLLQAALAFIASHGDPPALMQNHVLETPAEDAISLKPLSST
jgi:predicted nuclease of predicted toxin-antitoxin system